MSRVRRRRPARPEQRTLTAATLRGMVSGLVGAMARWLLDHFVG
ncbi:hypothetical protein [Amycolatopsis thailandensis]|nr:hypothetical protein [Amycolatopsis thailandensis]